MVDISAGVLTGLGTAVLVGTGIVVLVTSVIEVVGLLELTESTNWGELVLVSCVPVSYTHLTLPTNREV